MSSEMIHTLDLSEANGTWTGEDLDENSKPMDFMFTAYTKSNVNCALVCKRGDRLIIFEDPILHAYHFVSDTFFLKEENFPNFVKDVSNNNVQLRLLQL